MKQKLGDHEVKRAIDEQLDRNEQYATPLYAIYYKGKQLAISKARVYYHEGRAKAELIRMFKHSIYFNGTYHNEYDRATVKRHIEDLLKSGELEIRKL